ncbi:outer membrane protein assembly factor BamD [Geomonas sp. RF6]|uniref:tetratricopeptide repeat protein n=1 Tax=Geomonas sp. RF6 TaxID=2897342 RepID=UPI001E500B31|nr:outer membrane protein assembly factor BamD [Geomonas sp. RF6]UFS71890.1 outer membrane protein assembly factor BamD [Geomonas sp. RF6]
MRYPHIGAHAADAAAFWQVLNFGSIPILLLPRCSMSSLYSSSVFLASLLIGTLLPVPVSANDSEAPQLFIAAFNAYQKKEYGSSVEQMETLLKKYPKSQVRDMALFWLAKGQFRKGNRLEGAKLMAQFLRDFPESPLKFAVDEELRELVVLYIKGEPLPPSPSGKKETAGPPAPVGAAAAASDKR